MSCQYFCDACEDAISVDEKYFIYYMFPLGEHVSKFEFCKGCMKKVTRYMKSLREKK